MWMKLPSSRRSGVSDPLSATIRTFLAIGIDSNGCGLLIKADRGSQDRALPKVSVARLSTSLRLFARLLGRGRGFDLRLRPPANDGPHQSSWGNGLGGQSGHRHDAGGKQLHLLWDAQNFASKRTGFVRRRFAGDSIPPGISFLFSISSLRRFGRVRFGTSGSLMSRWCPKNWSQRRKLLAAGMRCEINHEPA